METNATSSSRISTSSNQSFHLSKNEKSVADKTKEVFLLILSRLSIEELKTCRLLCGACNNLVLENGLVYKRALFMKEGEEAIALFTPLISSGSLTWKETLDYPNLASFFTRVIQKDMGYYFIINTFANYAPCYNRGRAAYADFRFLIEDETHIKVQQVGCEPFILYGDTSLIALAASGDYVYALRVDGTIIKWNYKTDEQNDINWQANYSDLSNRKINFEFKDDFILIMDLDFDIATIISLESSKDFCFIKYPSERLGIKVEIDEDKIFSYQTNEVIYYKSASTRLTLSSNHIYNVQLGKSYVLAQEEGGEKGTLLCLYDLEGKRIQSIDFEFNVEKMDLYGNFIFCTFYANLVISNNKLIQNPSMAVFDVNSGKKVLSFSHIIDHQSLTIKHHVLKSIFDLFKSEKES